ncbi:SAR2788 family putative toxin [Bacillus inaquosorum]|uniref:SAR2788 family putative toxin n=1 Tax=Bacillus inaquosorum TaxID=483913 RepID=UPI00227F1246|nr:SAR2788 family putative toxin [Bacillus inaquosorum]MCY9014908.1 SAR2788 family putative toxin [Bacillus inaquosorum]MCY9041979.1 SAR2788 family putative toxin [Bacillus inaquosorum]MCY9105360.1 SAR2788 family putative toxin [Bacillus inaquosorum]MCY9123079.1 SAR2788 family putative toxin [Bacillus inaquosorum]
MKYFISFLLAVFVFYSVGTEFVSATTNQNINEEELIDTDETLTETIDSDQIDSETEEIFGESIDDSNVELESDINGNEATIQTNIETDDLSVDGELELDLDTSSMVVSAEAEDDSGEVFNGEFNVELQDINDDGDFIATVTDTKTGEEFNVNTAEVHASWYPLVWIAIVVARIGIKQAIKKFGKTSVKQATKKYGTKTSASKAVRKVSMKNLDDHYGKHKKEFGNITKSQYLNKARTFLGKATSKTVLEKRSKKKFGGNYRYYKYNKKTNEFLSVERQGNKDTIITYFKPKHPNKKAGYNYYKNQ